MLNNVRFLNRFSRGFVVVDFGDKFTTNLTYVGLTTKAIDFENNSWIEQKCLTLFKFKVLANVISWAIKSQ